MVPSEMFYALSNILFNEEIRRRNHILQYPLCGPYRTRISTYVALGIGDLLLQLHSLLIDIHKVLDNRKGKADRIYFIKQ